ncbi:MAG: NUDIX hydrolase [Actinobacteria bacterium]|nr:NUDIX hydrolase [Actinomycetota bacterium]
MAHRDGDGWVQCRCGNKHWGLHGAAGLLLVRGATLLLQHRSEWVHNGDTWGIPGGARDSHESIHEAAIREAIEETGIDPDLVTFHSLYTDDHVDWRYDTIIAIAAPELFPHEMNAESQELRWVNWEEIDSMPLHPSFAKSWTAVHAILKRDFPV